MWDLLRPGLKPVSPALAGGFLTNAPPGKSPDSHIFSFFFIHFHLLFYEIPPSKASLQRENFEFLTVFWLLHLSAALVMLISFLTSTPSWIPSPKVNWSSLCLVPALRFSKGSVFHFTQWSPNLLSFLHSNKLINSFNSLEKTPKLISPQCAPPQAWLLYNLLISMAALLSFQKLQGPRIVFPPRKP